jgi:hypothetical protein
MRTLTIGLSLATSLTLAQSTWQSSLVRFGNDGRLSYVADTAGNRIPDFSYAGYENGNQPIPTVTRVLDTLSPLPGDNVAQIAAAVQGAASVTPDSNGIRGVILLKPGVWRVGTPVKVNVSGVILRGAGSGSDTTANTVFQSTGDSTTQYSVVIAGGGSQQVWKDTVAGTTTDILDTLVPEGALRVTVAAPGNFSVGDGVRIAQPCTQAWLTAIGGGGGGADWAVGSVVPQFKRYVTAIHGDTLVLDAPLFNNLYQRLAQSTVTRLTGSGIVTKVGLEHFRVDIEGWTDSLVDNNTPAEAVDFFQIENSWANDVVCLHFKQAAFRTNTASLLTFEDCQGLEPVGTYAAEHRYGYDVYNASTGILFLRCHMTRGRHSFISNGGPTVSNIAIVRCTSADPISSAEGHRLWSMGMLFDVYRDSGAVPDTGEGRVLGLYDRGTYGSGHGWGAVNSVVWNPDTRRSTGANGNILVQQPPTGSNFLIGGYGTLATYIPFSGASGWIEGFDSTSGLSLSPQSLYEQQLADRLGTSATGVATRPEHTLAGMDLRNLGQGNWSVHAASAGSVAVADLEGRRIATSTPGVQDFRFHLSRSGVYLVRAGGTSAVLVEP